MRHTSASLVNDVYLQIASQPAMDKTANCSACNPAHEITRWRPLHPKRATLRPIFSRWLASPDCLGVE
jgi:hypothetical protein